MEYGIQNYEWKGLTMLLGAMPTPLDHCFFIVFKKNILKIS